MADPAIAIPALSVSVGTSASVKLIAKRGRDKGLDDAYLPGCVCVNAVIANVAGLWLLAR